jgi:DNA processing protein
VDLRTVEGIFALQAVEGVTPDAAFRLARQYATWDELVDADPAMVAIHAGRPLSFPAHPPDSPPPAAPGVQAVCAWDDSYPKPLFACDSPPPVVWIRGTLPPGADDWDWPATVGIVGSRDATRYGLSLAAAAGTAAAAERIPVISGLAEGVDATAVRACLDAGGATWAALDHGLDNSSLRARPEGDLARSILDSGGGLISEVPPGTPSSTRTRRIRGRLIAVLSRVLIVAQAAPKSGTMRTVRYAFRYGVPIAAGRPGPPYDQDPQSAGLLALTDPAGCDLAAIWPEPPDWLDEFRLEARLAAGGPVATFVVPKRDALPPVWAACRTRL